MHEGFFRVPAVDVQAVFVAHGVAVAGERVGQVFGDDVHVMTAGVDDGVGVVCQHDVAGQVEQVAARQVFQFEGFVVRAQVFFLQVAVARDVASGAAVAPLGERRAVKSRHAAPAPDVAAPDLAARRADRVGEFVRQAGVAAVQPAAVVQLQVVAVFGDDFEAGVRRQGGQPGAFEVGRGGDGGNGDGGVRPVRFAVVRLGGCRVNPAAVVVAQGLGVQPAVARVQDAQRFAVGVLAQAGARGVRRGVYPGFGDADAGVAARFSRRIEAGVVFALDFDVVHGLLLVARGMCLAAALSGRATHVAGRGIVLTVLLSL